MKVKSKFSPSMKRKIGGMTEAERVEAFQTANYVPHERVFKNKRGPKNDNLNKCLQILEVRSIDRGGDTSIKNEVLAGILKVSERQVTRYITDLEKQGFISVLYTDNPKIETIHETDVNTGEKIVQAGSFVVHKTKSTRLTFRFIRCWRIIAKNGYEAPHRKVDPNSRKFKPFARDLRPPLEEMKWDKIPVEEMERARFLDIDAYNVAVMTKEQKLIEERNKALADAADKLMTLDQALAANLIPPKPEEAKLIDPFDNLFDHLGRIGKYAGPVYDPEIMDLYYYYKNLQEKGDPLGIAVMGKEFHKPKHLDAVPDNKAMYFKPKSTDGSQFISTDDPDWLAKSMIGMTKAWEAKKK